MPIINQRSKLTPIIQKLAYRMIWLRPFAETVSGQELIKDTRIAILTTLLQEKFLLSESLAEAIRANLDKLDAEALTLLVRQILHGDTFEEVEQWIAARIPQTAA